MRKSVTSWKKQRKAFVRDTIKHRIYIFCEGEETEPKYFEAFKRLIENNAVYKNTVHIEIKGLGKETLRIIQYAQAYTQKNQLIDAVIWCVYDKDSFPPKDFNAVAETARNLNNNQSVLTYKTAWSNQCFEYWYILHFDYYVSDNDRKDYEKYLCKKFESLGKGSYAKNSADTFGILLDFGSPKQAIKHARKRIDDCKGLTDSESAPATYVFELVQDLSQFLPDDIRNKFI